MACAVWHTTVCSEGVGWEKLGMVRKHAHLNADHLAEYANVVTFRSQQELEKKKPLARVAYLLDFTMYFWLPKLGSNQRPTD